MNCDDILHDEEYDEEPNIHYIYMVHDTEGKVIAPCTSEEIAKALAVSLLGCGLRWKYRRGGWNAYNMSGFSVGWYIKVWELNTWE